MRLSPLLLLLALLAGWSQASQSLTASAIEADARRAAVAWLDALGPQLAKQAVFPMDHAERRAWSNLPHSMFARQGVAFGEMDDAQRRAAHQLLRSVLSSAGYLRATGIMRGDDILMASYGALPEGRTPQYGHDFYWIGLFGDPRGEGAWGLQLDGHHLALNVTAARGQLRVTPTFLGANPVEVVHGPYAGWNVMSEPDELALKLYHSLTDEQKAVAVVAKESPGDILAGPGKADLIGARQGIAVDQLDGDQRQLLEQIVREFVDTYRGELAIQGMHEFRKDLEEGVHFAWFGGGDPAQSYAFRIHGKRNWIELAQMNGMDSRELGVNHIHAIWRRLGDDYGVGLLAAAAK